MNTLYDDYYYGPERRIARESRRSIYVRRHRNRTESLVCDCRDSSVRRKEDEEGYTGISSLYPDDETPDA